MDETRKRKVGRLPKKDPAVFRYTISLNTVQHDKFLSLFEQSRQTVKAHFITSCIFSQPVKVVQIDKGMQDYYMRLTTFYGQFRAIGTNYNQIVKTLKSNFSEKKALALLYKLEKVTIELVELQRKISAQIEDFEHKYSSSWLQK
ncbi:hypothetical protein JGH11_01575 [Dysgonomonas sp. Marseille-P4677]|uniref:conjugal transfer protein MobA n=1 Tax=Dysgonomonas sp. Marseille-P4677 TaxID=2364790 RepID=UPI001912B304|nr:conjugal transfer protein MobA [Dysgonomonas sp. Marseille-P4677]MBK5719553.1 hypothetical protein [Dysgonomonas sp. Marseille-P4677]